MSRESSAAAARELTAARLLFEQVLLDLSLLSGASPRNAIAGALEQAIAALAAVADSSRHLHELRAARAAGAAAEALVLLDGTAAGRRAGERLCGARRALASYEERALTGIGNEPAKTGPRGTADELAASSGTPALHHLERPPLQLHVRIATRDEDGVDDGGAPSPSPGIAAMPRIGDGRAASFHAQLRRIARDALEELGALGGLRRCEGDSSWSPALAAFEQRLLTDLDLIAALGAPAPLDADTEVRIDVAAEASAYGAEAVFGDTVRAFAKAFVLGCIAGEDTVRAAVLALRQSHPFTRDAQRSALSLASNPAIGRACADLLRHDDHALVTVALDVLAARGAVPFELVVAPAAHPHPAVRRSAARCFGRVRDRKAASNLLARMLEDERDGAVTAAAVVSLVSIDRVRALAFARERVEADAGGAFIIVLALAGGARDGTLLAQRFAGAGIASPNATEIAEALGWHGHPSHVGPLIDALGTCGLPRAFERACENALRRITGSPEGAPISGAASARKHRFGRPYTPSSSLDELGAGGVPAATRETLALEVAIASEGESRLDVHGWVAAQLDELTRLRALFDARDPPWRPGMWA